MVEEVVMVQQVELVELIMVVEGKSGYTDGSVTVVDTKQGGSTGEC